MNDHEIIDDLFSLPVLIQILRPARLHRAQHGGAGEDGQAERRDRPRRPAQRGHRPLGLQRPRHPRL